MELLAYGGIAVSPQLFVVRGQQDWMPGGNAAEGLCIAHVKARDIAIGGTERIGPNARLGRLVDQGHMLLPGIGLSRRLA